MDIATAEIGRVEMIATMVTRLLEGAPATATTKMATAVPVVGAVLYDKSSADLTRSEF